MMWMNGKGPRRPEGMRGEMQLVQLMQVSRRMSQRMCISALHSMPVHAVTDLPPFI